MFVGTRINPTRRIVSLWFPRLSTERVLRLRPQTGPFALTLKESNANRIYCLNAEAEQSGLHRGMPFSDARAFCAGLNSQVVDLAADQRFLLVLRRWATRYCPWVGLEGRDGLTLDITGSAHLFGGEVALIADIQRHLARAGISVAIGVAATRGAAWAVAHYAVNPAPVDDAQAALAPLPVAALRLENKTVVALQRLGLRHIGDLIQAARAPLMRRFGPDLLMRLDQALGTQPEEITPLAEPPHYAVRITLPDPIGLAEDVMAGTARLLDQLCRKLVSNGVGARVLQLTLRRVDREAQQVELRLARALHDPARILPLFERAVQGVDAGFGIDQLRLEASRVEQVVQEQISHVAHSKQDRLDDLITRIGARIGLENIQRFLPADSHIPERSFLIAPAAFSTPDGAWGAPPLSRPLQLFPPEGIAGHQPQPPTRFRWRRMGLTVGRAIGPERIAPEWWLEDENWRSGLRDYWRIETREGRRLWLFYTPQAPAWFVHGEFA
ncbi:Y-family DNA polymerase [Loktanella sp. S4079]|uniref:Y-family DNA polymerase n=1 Tax=Loktanella sp. S4079 TaxID=579483 RepID=UPI0005FA1075|nr:DNA polymerase Y family protein [Loktanella sp. S4079]KJZ17551.1 nucleotidyltransferase [Loktanella sp. S4079]